MRGMMPRAKRRWPGAALAAALAVGAWWAPLAAQDGGPLPLDWSFDPVFEQNGVDGFLLGGQADVTFQGFRPFAAAGYGFDSGALRYRAGLGWGDGSASLYDWPDSPVLGRTGEAGMALKYDAGGTAVSLRQATLWALADEAAAPQVSYLHGKNTHTLTGGFDFSLRYTGTMTVGTVAGGGVFESASHALNARWGQVRASFSTGTASNGAGLPGFEFTQGFRGDDEPLKGHAFWRARLERRVRLLREPQDLRPLLPEGAPAPFRSLTFRLEASGFAEALRVLPNPDPQDDSGDPLPARGRLGWGGGLVLSLDEVDFELRFDLFFDQTGVVKPLFG